MVVVGGYADMWGFALIWDDHVKAVRRMFSLEGILTITGAPLYQTVQII